MLFRSSKNLKLYFVNCSNNQLENLDVSANSLLTTLHCLGNSLTNLDITQNSLLGILACGRNQLAKLDISKNPVLNQVPSTQFKPRLDLSGMSSLSQVCVSTMPYPPVGLNLNIEGSPNIFFTVICD